MALFRALYDRLRSWSSFEIYIAFGNAQYFTVRRKQKPAQLPVARVVTRG